MASLREHSGAVNRLALSQDQAFFVSASSDGTCKVIVCNAMPAVARMRCTFFFLSDFLYENETWELTQQLE